MQLFLDSGDGGLIASHAGLRRLQFGLAKIQRLLGDRFQRDERTASFDHPPLHVEVGFGLAQHGARAEVVAHQFAELDIVVGGQGLPLGHALTQTDPDPLDEAACQRPDVGDSSVLGGDAACHVDRGWQRANLNRPEAECRVFLRVGCQLHDASGQFVRVFFGDLRPRGRGTQHQPGGRAGQYGGDSDGNKERAHRNARFVLVGVV